MQWLYWLFLGDSKNFHNCSNIIHHHIPFLLLRQRCCCIGHRLRSDIYLKNKGIIREQPRNRQLFCGFAPHCKSVVYDFGGSNPPPSTKAKRHSKRNVFSLWWKAGGGFERWLLETARWAVSTTVASVATEANPPPDGSARVWQCG